MKRLWMTSGLAAALLISAPVLADDAVPAADPGVSVKVNAERDVDVDRQSTETKVQTGADLIGMTVKNSEGKSLGTINDAVVDLQSGKIRYVAVSFGGFAGIGDKLFAVPFQAVAVHQGDKPFVEFDVTEKTLENAQGFDQDKWPDFGDAKWVMMNDRAYDFERKNEVNDGSLATADSNSPVDVTAMRLSTLDGITVKNTEGDTIGSISDVALNMKKGQVEYVALSFGGFAGIGDKLFAVPLEALKFQKGENENFLVMNVTEKQLEDRQGFDQSNWPHRADQTWSGKTLINKDRKIDINVNVDTK
ncbi:PRC-barrel domain-containing protein [Blastopirellula sp. JC732]|uniref:PRC-barrel domain-containing protein n=1 Tax=Blastopirellula sediminis TaxID=2894196 RepID=A0A9X1MMZ2_9BACT|nr:PRC-barrel domain-containing protein [Blastopirellula sediminis]MCC9607171.1 PRC-barrel domain-containing protein [Blastopirellula sediminis]MCC9629536.1 PRC-barrel domain-containing protein [Blastopirellula sediminis]